MENGFKTRELFNSFVVSLDRVPDVYQGHTVGRNEINQWKWNRWWDEINAQAHFKVTSAAAAANNGQKWKLAPEAELHLAI